jgi:arylsulfatase A-like enzyme
MRILYIDVDSLRPDHLGCYGYHRDTSPTIDALAEDARRFTNCYASDVPCGPSRSALFSVRFGIHSGVVNHGGTNADRRPQGESRGFSTSEQFPSFPQRLSDAAHHTALISPFPSRHGAWHTLDGFDEWHDTGGNGNERAETVAPVAEQWLEEHATDEDWYLHVNFWDPHTPYDTPAEYGNPFEDTEPPAFPDPDTIADQYAGYGPHSAHEPHAWGLHDGDGLPERTPEEIADREDFRQWIDGYDVAIRYVDDHLGRLFDTLRAAGVFEETLIVLSADHGENQGELNVYGDHQTADEITCNVPLIVRGPGVEAGVDEALRYNVDIGPTLVDLVDGTASDDWDGASFAPALRGADAPGRDYLVVSQCAWACQRAVRWDEYLLIRTYHDGLKQFDPVELYDVRADPHETTNLARDRPAVVREGLQRLHEWHSQRLLESATGTAGGNPDAAQSPEDPLFRVITEGGPFHARTRDREHVEAYAERLRETGRPAHAQTVAEKEGIVSQSVTAYLEEAPQRQ